MELQKRAEAFVSLGKQLSELKVEDLGGLIFKAHADNPWFTEKSIIEAFHGLAAMLTESEMGRFINQYDFSKTGGKAIGLVLAGNIPAVGFHDVMCVLLSGNKAVLKMSSQDKVCMMFLFEKLFAIAPELGKLIKPIERLKLDEVDAVIATGSDNTARYFEQYFSRVPNLIRKNRTSVAVLNGQETKEDFEALGGDIFQYYGLGCRNVSKLFVPKGYNMVPLLDGLEKHHRVLDHSKYDNNYTYYKSIYLVNGDEHLDTGYCIFKKDERLVSPIGAVFYEEYSSEDDLANKLIDHKDKIQCTVGKDYIPFGKAQTPAIDDYADGVDTMEFILGDWNKHEL